MADQLELDDVQGLVVRGYGRLRAARYVLGEITDARLARKWLGQLSSRVATGVKHDDDTAVNVALTPSGLRALGLPDDVLEGFSAQFLDGMTAEHRRRLLGDRGADAPEHWSWGNPGGERIDVLLLVYATDDARIAGVIEGHERSLTDGGIRVLRTLDTAELEPREHFGFRDGVSQPRIAGLGDAPDDHTVAPGEVVLGYRNEYGRFTPRPLVHATADPQGLLAADAEGSGQRDLGRNGSYLVFRQLSQDVNAFWGFCEHATRRPDGSQDAAARVRLAAKLVGRWPSGAPLVLAPEEDRPELGEANDFAYHDPDPHGLACPLGSHVRRANPRDSLDPRPGTAQSIAVNKRHRRLRRGRQYGPMLPVADVLSPGVEEGWKDDPRGLHFICLVANISRQFEFVQHTWCDNPRFNGLYDHPDPLLGGATPDERTFTVQAEPVREHHTGLPRFTTVRGGAYFFLPGLRALRYLAEL